MEYESELTDLSSTEQEQQDEPQVKPAVKGVSATAKGRKGLEYTVSVPSLCIAANLQLALRLQAHFDLVDM